MDTQNIRTILHTFHTNLIDAHQGQTYRLYANGRRYELAEHTPESRTAHRGVAPHLAHLLKDLTHYTAEPVELPNDQVIRVHLESDLTGPGVEKGAKGTYHSAIVQPPAQGHESHTEIGWTSTAKSLLFHHPDLITQDPKVASIVLDYMDNEVTSKEIVHLIDVLAARMKKMGPPTLTSGWAKLVPIKIPLKKGETTVETTLYQQEPSEAAMKEAGDVMTAMMIATKNDPRLRGQKWTQEIGSSVVSNQSPDVSMLAEIRGTAADWKAKLTREGEQHGLQTTLTVTDAGTRTVNVKMKNTYVRWLGVYVSFYDAEGKPLDISSWNVDLELTNLLELERNQRGIKQIVPIENNWYRHLDVLEPMDTLMAIPTVPGLLNHGEGITFSFPNDHAASAKIFGCGLGTGDIPYGNAVIVGAVKTGLCNIAIPSALLGFKVAANSYKELYDLTKNKKVKAMTK